MKDAMYEWLDGFPQQVKQAAQIGAEWSPQVNAPSGGVAFLGIGGSAIGADLICRLYSDCFPCPVVVTRGNEPPAWLKSGNHAVAISYSGDTQETLTAFRRALDQGADGICISSGGKLAKLAEERGIPHLSIPGGMAPRAALGYTSLPLIFLLQKLQAMTVEEIEIEPVFRQLLSIREEWGDPAGSGAGVARRLLKRLPLIVGQGFCGAAARRFQAQLAENAKTISVVFDLPEALHNLVETLDVHYLESFRPIAVYIEDPEAPEETKRLLKQTRDAFQNAGVEGIPILSQGKAPLARLFSLVYKTDWISYHLAGLKGADPVAIPIIKSIKES